MPRNEDPAVVEERRALVDKCLRRGWSPYDIAKLLATDEKYVHLIESVSHLQKEGDSPGKLVHAIRERLVRTDVEAIRARFKREVSPSDAETALLEYVSRLDHIYEELNREYADAPDHRDRIAAMRAAHEVAEAKARVLGVDTEPKVAEGLQQALGGLALTQLVHAAAGRFGLPEPKKELPEHHDAIDGASLLQDVEFREIKTAPTEVLEETA